MKHILLIAETSGLDAQGFNAQGFDEAHAEAFEDIAARYQVVFPADHLSDAPHLGAGISAAFLVTDLASYERLKTLDLPGDLLFQPSATARLDLLKRGRKTLIAAAPIKAGTILEAKHLNSEQGGPGVDISLKSEFLGRAVHYDLEAGTALDFGMISEDPVTGETS